MTNAIRRLMLEIGAASAAAALAALAPAVAGGEEQPVRGWLEHAHIEPSGISLDAKLDTGARTSSIHAEILRGPNLDDDDEEEVEEDVEEETVEVVEDAGPVTDTPDAETEVAEASGAEATAAATAAPAAETTPADAPAAEAGDSDIEVIEDESDPEVEEVEDASDDDTTIVFRITNEQGESSTLQRDVVRFVEIKNRDGTTERRPVVEITACLAGVWVTGEVNLADREDFNYPFLVGRNMLEASGIIVDAREIYTRSARCTDPAP